MATTPKYSVNWDALASAYSGQESTATTNSDSSDYLSQRVEATRRNLETIKRAHAEAVERQKLNKDSFVSQLGLTPGTLSAEAVDLGASFASGTVRTIGAIASLPAFGGAIGDVYGLNEEDFQAYARYRQGKATDQDMALLNRPKNAQAIPGLGPEPSVRESIERAQLKAGFGRDLNANADKSHWVHQDSRQELVQQLKGNFDQPWGQVKQGWDQLKSYEDGQGWKNIASGLGQLILNAGEAAVDNPMGAAEYITENIPQLAVGAMGRIGQGLLKASNAGYAFDNYQQGIEKYQKENNGELPPPEKRQEMAMWAASLALAEQAGDVSLLKGIMGDGAEKLARKGIKEALLDVGAKTAKGTASESATEGYQTYAEGQATLKPSKAEDIYVGAAIGGMAGGGMTAGATSAGVLANNAAAGMAEVDAARKAQEAQNKLLDQAVAEGKPEMFLDKASENYSPDQAIKVLHRLASAPQTTSEQRAQYQAQAKEILDGYEQELAQAEQGSMAKYQESVASLDAFRAEVAALDPQSEIYPLAQERLALMEEEVAAGAPSEQVQAAEQQQAEALRTKVAQAQKVYEALTTDAVGDSLKDLDIEAAVQSVDQVVDANDPVAVQKASDTAKKLVLLSMASPDSLAPDVALKLANNTSNGLSDGDRKYLTSYADAAQAIGDLKTREQVHQEVLYGDKTLNQMGLTTYQSRMGKFLAAGDTARATKLMEGLTKFMVGHQSKAAAVSQAYAEFQRTKQTMQVVKSEGGWVAQKQTQTAEELKANKGYLINDKSKRFIQNIALEAAAIAKTHKSLEAAIERVTNVQANPTQQPAAVGTPTGQAEVSTAVQAASAPGVPETAVTGTVSNEGNTPDVEAAGVSEQKVTAPASSVIPDLSALYPKRVFREMTEAELAVVTDVLNTLRGVLGSQFAEVDHILVHGNSTHRGTYFYDQKILTLDAKLFTDGLPKLGITDPAQAVKVIVAHELSHARDQQEGFPSQQSSQLREGGALFEEAKAVLDVGKSHPLYAWLKNIVFRDAHSPETTASELYAQLFTLYVFNKELMQEHLPIAYGKIEATLTGTQPAGQGSPSSEVVRSVPDGRRDTTASQETTGTQPADEQQKEPQLSEPGRLSALSASPVGKWIKQTAGGLSAATERPLAKVKDFLSAWSRGEVYPSDFLKEAMDESQQAAVQFFAQKANQWSAVIDGLLAQNKDAKYFNQAPVQYLIEEVNGQLTLEENIKTAISMAAMTWVSETLGRGLVNDDAAINAILDRDEDIVPTDAERDALSYAGVRRNIAINSLGQRIVAALGWQAAQNAPKDLMPKLETGLGVYALTLMAQEGLVEIQSVDLPGMKRNAFEEQVFVRLAQVTDGQVNDKVSEIAQALKGSKSVLESLFSVESGMKAPTFEAVPFNQKKAKDSKQRVPQWLAKILDKKNREANYLKQDTWALLSGMGTDVVLAMAGQETNLSGIHVDRLKGTQAKNDGLKREWDNFVEFVDNYLSKQEKAFDAPFFFAHNVWKQQRVGILNNMVNPQTSKIHRFLIKRKAWETTVDTTNEKQMNNFKLRVLEGFGVKTDKEASALALARWDSQIETSEVAAAVQAIQARLAGADLSVDQQQAIAQAVKTAGQKFHSLDALMALAAYRSAPAGGKFTTALVGEIDGVTNGPMLSHILLGAAKSTQELFGFINKGGFFQQGSAFENYNLWRGSEGQMDLYESTASVVVNAIQKLFGFNQKRQEALAALWEFTGQLDDGKGKIEKEGRDIVKKPITALMFGSSTQKVVDGMADQFVESVYKAIEKVAQGKKDRVTVLEQLNVMLQPLKGWPLSMTAEQMLRRSLSNAEKAQIKAFFKGTMGGPVQNTMKTVFASLLERRNQINRTAKVTFGLYNSVYQAVRQEFIADLIKKGELETDGAGNPIWDLSAEQEAQLERVMSKLQPVMHTVMSLRSNDLSAGLAVAKTERQLSQDPQYHQQVPVRDGNKTRLVKTNAQQVVTLDPGVAMVPMGTHSADSGISHGTNVQSEALNVHDALVTGLNDFLTVAGQFNSETWKTLVEYSPANEMYASMERTVRGMLQLLKSTNNDPTVVKALKEYLAGLSVANRSKGSLSDVLIKELTLAKQNAFEADKIRLGALAQLQSVDQYAMEGGQYTVTDADRQKALDALAKLNGQVPADLVQQIQALEAVFKGVAYRKVEVAPVQEKESPATPAIETVFGAVGTPRVQPEADVVAMVEQVLGSGESMKASQVMGRLRGLLKARGNDRISAFYWNLSTRVMRALGPDVMVQYIKPGQDTTGMAIPDVASRGWYDPNTQTIYILSPEFVNSGLTAELLMHELTHGALRDVIEQLQTPGAKLTTVEQRLKEDLENILQVSRAYVKDRGLTGFDNALQNLHELVSWGMFNEKFQNEVLNKVQVKSKITRGLTSAFEGLVRTLLAFLYPGQKFSAKAPEVTGLAALLANTSYLYRMAEDHKKRQSQGGAILSQATPDEAIDQFTTQQVFDALNGQNNSAAFTEKLQSLLDDVVTKLHGPFGAIKAQIQQKVGNTALDAWAHAQATGQRILASQALAAPLKINAQEGFVIEQVEATIRAALDDKSTATNAVMRELEKLWAQSKEALKGKIDPDLYRFVFLPQKLANGRSDYLSRFAALGLGSESFNQALAFETKKPEMVLKGKTIMQALETIWRTVVDRIGAWRTGTYLGQHADDKLQSLVTQLVQAEAKAKQTIKSSKSVLDFLDPVEDKAAAMVEGAKATIGKAAGSSFIKNSKFAAVRATGKIVELTAKGRVGKVVEGLTNARNQAFKERPGQAMALLNYVKGIPQWTNELLQMSKKTEKERLFHTHQTAKAVLGSFDQEGAYLKAEDKAAISAVLLRTGAHTLLDTYTVDEIQGLLEDPAALKQAIEKEVGALQNFPEVHYYIKQAKGLAFFRTTGKVDVEHQMLNASNIARLFGTGMSAPAHAKQVEATIERLVTLYGLSYSQPSQVNQLLQVMRKEAPRGENNGILMTLLMHQYLDQDSKTRLFNGSEALRIHGYTPEILNPKTSFVVTRDPEEGQALMDKGYTRVDSLSVDKTDPEGGVPVLYVLKGGGLNRRQSGVVSFTGMQGKGESKHDNFYHPLSPEGVANMQSMSQIHALNSAAVRAQFDPDPDYNPVAKTRNLNVMLPLLNKRGQIVDYRYVMAEKTKDTLLERDNSFERLLGVMAGSTFDKEESQEHNRQAMQALNDVYRKDFAKAPDNFIHIHASSTDAEMREIWNLIPEHTKKDIRKIWGNNGIYVPKDLVDVLFGYRKASLGDSIGADQKNAVEKALTSMVTTFLYGYGRMKLGKSVDDARQYSKRGAVAVRKAEDVVQEAVKVVKDTIVVKTIVVLRDNILSNSMMLAMKGVPTLDSFKHQHTALKGAMDYERDHSALAQIKAKLETGFVQGMEDELRAEMTRLEDALARNPVKELIDAGLMPTIVEDIAMEDDPYSYKSHFTEWVEDKTRRVNPSVMNVMRGLYMTHDTTLYKLLSKTTQYSDFVARYALYQHLTTRKKNPLSKQDAIFEVSESFVNYDIPLPKWMQYGDDMGVMMFIKYFLSMQRVLAKTAQDDPLRVLMVLGLNSYMGNLPMPTDSSFLVRFGNNPLSSSVFAYPGAVGELATVQTGMSLVK